MYFDNSPLDAGTVNIVARNTIAYNDIGIAFVPSVKRNVITANRFEDNLQQVAVVASGTFEGNVWTQDGVGNYWSNYAGFDADGDGVGDIPHAETSLFHSLLEVHPMLRLFTLSPAQSALDLAARAFPAFRPPATLTDTAPFTRAPTAPLPAVQPATGPLIGLSAACIALAAAAMLWGRLLASSPPAFGSAGRISPQIASTRHRSRP